MRCSRPRCLVPSICICIDSDAEKRRCDDWTIGLLSSLSFLLASLIFFFSHLRPLITIPSHHVTSLGKKNSVDTHTAAGNIRQMGVIFLFIFFYFCSHFYFLNNGEGTDISNLIHRKGPQSKKGIVLSLCYFFFFTFYYSLNPWVIQMNETAREIFIVFL